MEAHAIFIFAERIAGSVQQGIGPGYIVWIMRDIAIVGPMVRRQQAIGEPSSAAEEVAQHGRAINSASERLADANVFQNRVAKIECQILQRRSRMAYDLQAMLALQCADQVGGKGI